MSNQLYNQNNLFASWKHIHARMCTSKRNFKEGTSKKLVSIDYSNVLQETKKYTYICPSFKELFYFYFFNS
jgi:hypothetical protein